MPVHNNYNIEAVAITELQQELETSQYCSLHVYTSELQPLYWQTDSGTELTT